nr:uncharacterized protein LOC110149060 [Odocoileus virginianus texanus]
MWGQSLWAGVVHTPGESRLGGMGRVQAPPAAQAHLMPSEGVSILPVGYLSRHAFLLIPEAEVRAGRSSSHTARPSSVNSKQGWLDGHCHFRASHKIWLMRGTPHPPSHGRSQSTTPLPGRPSAGSRRVCPQRGQPNQELRGSREGLLPRHHPGHTPGPSLRLPWGSAHPAPTQSPRTSASEAAGGPGAQHGRAQSSAARLQPGSTSKTCPYSGGCYTCRIPSPRHRCPTPSASTSTSTCTCPCSGFGRRTRVRA